MTILRLAGGLSVGASEQERSNLEVIFVKRNGALNIAECCVWFGFLERSPPAKPPVLAV